VSCALQPKLETHAAAHSVRESERENTRRELIVVMGVRKIKVVYKVEF